MKKYLIILGLIIALVICVCWFNQSEDLGATPSAGAEIDYAADIVGTRVGTSTTGVMFSGDHTVASSTYKFGVGGANSVILTMKATNASSTPSGSVNLTLAGSNDWDCLTATTSADVGNPILVDEINWYDIGDQVVELAGTKGLTGTSTITWSPSVAQGKAFTLSNLNFQCIRMVVSASSTELLIQARLKK